MFEQNSHPVEVTDSNPDDVPVSYAKFSSWNQYRANASSPSFVSAFAASGNSGTGTFCALPVASAGL